MYQMAHAALPKSKKKAQEKEVSQGMAKLLSYLSDYGAVEAPQPAEEAQTDNQLKSIITALAVMIDRKISGTIVDVGAGKGILLERLASLDAFGAAQTWQYQAVEEKGLHDDVLAIAMRHRMHRRTDVVGLDDFYKSWRRPDTDRVVAVCRNVFHELDIRQTASLCHHLASALRESDRVVLQDLAVFPRAEKGNACWRREDLEAVIRDCGFDLTSIDDTSPTGNRWFNIIAIRTNVASPAMDVVRQLVLNRRTEQWQHWHKLGALHPEDARFRPVQLAKIDFDLQYAGLTHQLASIGTQVQALTPQNEQLIAKEIFIKRLDSPLVPAPLTGDVLNEIHHFKDRANSQEALQAFLNSDKPISLIYGPTLMGKTTLVTHVLATFHHARLPIAIDLQSASTVWNILEPVFSATGCSVPIEVLGQLRNLRLTDVNEPLSLYWTKVSSRLIIAFDHFERVLQPSGEIADAEIAALLQLFGNTAGTKIIVTSRRDISVQSVPLELRETEGPPVGRFPLGPHVENLLSTVAGITQFPPGLLDAIDRHPHLAYLAALVLRKHGPLVAVEPNFLSDVRQRLRTALIERVADPSVQMALEVLSLLRHPVPREFAVQLSSEASVASGERAGLIVVERDVTRFGRSLVRCLEPLRVEIRVDDDGATLPDDPVDASRQRGSQRLGEISDAYLDLYRRDDDPRWLREATYHRMAMGNVAMLAAFGVAYRAEIFAAGEVWFRWRKDFKSALWAFDTVEGFGGTSVAVKMRIASCCLRVGESERGDRIFGELLAQYPSNSGIKTSYIDALLYVERFEDALRLLETAFPNPISAWPHGQYGRAYEGLHRYNDAVSSFRHQLALNVDAVVYSSLARALHRVGRRKEEHETLLRGVARHPQNRVLRIGLASWNEKNGFGDKALELFADLIEKDSDDGWIIYPYVQTLCAVGQLERASEFWAKVRFRTRPEFLRPVIEAHLLMRKGRFEDALASLEEGQADEHQDGQRSEIYVAWANAEEPGEDRRRVAVLGLRPVEELPGNVPVLISQCKLAVLAHKEDHFRQVAAKVRIINQQAPDLERIEREANVAFEGQMGDVRY